MRRHEPDYEPSLLTVEELLRRAEDRAALLEYLANLAANSDDCPERAALSGLADACEDISHDLAQVRAALNGRRSALSCPDVSANVAHPRRSNAWSPIGRGWRRARLWQRWHHQRGRNRDGLELRRRNVLPFGDDPPRKAAAGRGVFCSLAKSRWGSVTRGEVGLAVVAR